jgi:hypothetical protein
MSRPYIPKVVTANDLRLGDVVYWTASGTWTRLHAQAALYLDEQTANAALAAAAAHKLVIVGAYLADAKQGEFGPEPTHFREAFRTRGPSNYAHGKQVEV